MKASDQKLIDAHKSDYTRALTAAVMCLREDRKLLGVPKIRERIEQTAALRALGSDTSGASTGDIEKWPRETLDLWVAGLDRATLAAKAALEPKQA